MKDCIEKLRVYAIKHSKVGSGSVHGIAHWDRVSKNADSLWTSDVNLLVVKAFAYIHDVEREDDGYDLQHGPRAAALVDNIRDSELAFLNDDEILWCCTEQNSKEEIENVVNIIGGVL